MSHETVIKIKLHGKLHTMGDEWPEPDTKLLPMPLRLPKPLSLDGEDTFDCLVEESCKCVYGKMWRYMAVWHETEWLRSYVTQWGKVRTDISDEEAREIAQSILDQYSVEPVIEWARLDCDKKEQCMGARQVLDEYGYCSQCEKSLMYLPTANLGVCPECREYLLTEPKGESE